MAQPKVILQKPAIELATPGLKGISLIHYTMAASKLRSRCGVGNKSMPCKSGVAGSIPWFSIKPLSVEHSDSPVIKYKHKP